MNESSFKQGAFSWSELMTSDTDAAKSFYSTLFGWETEEMSMEGVDYTVLKVDGKPVGGIMPMPAECKAMGPVWGVYVTVDNVDAVAAKVEELGGRILKPPAGIPGVGRFCVLQDPQGAVLSAITYEKMD